MCIFALRLSSDEDFVIWAQCKFQRNHELAVCCRVLFHGGRERFDNLICFADSAESESASGQL
jgi:hypothetical protein